MALIFGTCIILLLFIGPLFPFAPAVPGFTRHESARSVIYIQSGARSPDQTSIDELLPDVERFYGLKFVKKPELFVFKDQNNFSRLSPSRARFSVYFNRLFISPRALYEAGRGMIDLDIYLRHELSHCLLYQNSGAIRYLRIPAWLIEGVAVLGAEQMGTGFYPDRAQTMDLVRQGQFMPPSFFKTGREDRVRLKVPYRQTFIYSEFACIVDGLIAAFGKDRFLDYLNRLLSGQPHDRVFLSVFGLSLDEFIRQFKESAADPIRSPLPRIHNRVN